MRNPSVGDDITYIPIARGFVYLAAVVDWFSRRVLSHRVSITMEADFCIEAQEAALAKHGRPEISSTDQGAQFTSIDFTGVLIRNAIAISMDGKGSWRDNVFVARLWRSVKYEGAYLRAYDGVSEAHAGSSLLRLVAPERGGSLNFPPPRLDVTPVGLSPPDGMTRRSNPKRKRTGRAALNHPRKTVQTNRASAQDHRSIRLRLGPMLGFNDFDERRSPLPASNSCIGLEKFNSHLENLG